MIKSISFKTLAPRTLFVVLILSLFTACAAPPKRVLLMAEEKKAGPLVIGVLADSQISTPNNVGHPVYRNKLSDLAVDVSIRTPAQEHLADKMLVYFLKRVASYQPHLILYLGDGANSGCSDEVDPLFKILKEQREASNIPIFFLIGNHDYLGAGNVPRNKARRELCGAEDDKVLNPPLSKGCLVKRAHDFNKESSDLPAFTERFTYEDAIDITRPQCEKSEGDDEQHRRGCYLAGRISDAQSGLIEILLVDTSDYLGRMLPPKDRYGTEGSISWQDKDGTVSQLSYFEGIAEKSDGVRVRIIASHYPPTYFESEEREFTTMGKPGRLLLPGGENYWISGHTHARKIKDEKKHFRQGERSVALRHFNVGSTTDHIPHAMLLTYRDGVMESPLRVAIEHVPLFKEKVDHAIDNAAPGDYHPVFDYSCGEGLFGLTADYCKEGWIFYDTQNARANIITLLDRMARMHPGWVEKNQKAEENCRLDVVAVLMERAAKKEFDSKPQSRLKKFFRRLFGIKED